MGCTASINALPSSSHKVSPAETPGTKKIKKIERETKQVFYDSDRGISATSTLSKCSYDSGIENEKHERNFSITNPDILEDDYAFVITEESHPDKVKEIEKGFSEPNSDLGIVGIRCARRSCADKLRLNEQLVLEALRQEGFIATSGSTMPGGFAYEINGIHRPVGGRLPPIRLQEKNCKKKEKNSAQEMERKKSAISEEELTDDISISQDMQRKIERREKLIEEKKKRIQKRLLRVEEVRRRKSVSDNLLEGGNVNSSHDDPYSEREESVFATA